MPFSSSTRPEKVPEFVLLHFAGNFPTAHLLVEGIEKLLAGGGAGERRSFEQRAAKAALIAKALRSAVERNAQSIHQVNDPRPPLAHFLYRRLVLQKIAAVNRVVEMEPLVITLLPRYRVDAVDPPWAQTLCDRFTGVRLITSTSNPCSASFMVADSPASPPPTIITR